MIQTVQQLTLLSPEALAWLEQNIVRLNFKKNEVVLGRGMVCQYLYFINKGIAGAWYEAEGREVCNWIACENDFAVSYYSFITGQASYETIECFEACEIDALSKEKLEEFYQLYPESERASRLLFEEYYARLEERLISIQFKSARERYDALMERRPEVFLRAPLGRIASYLGMNQETLSRVRAGKL